MMKTSVSDPEFQGGLSREFLCQSRCAAERTVREYSQITEDLVRTQLHTNIHILTHAHRQIHIFCISGINCDAISY